MTKDYAAIALRHAPVLQQKVNEMNRRGDYITGVDLSGDLSRVVENWSFVEDKDNSLIAEAYYSVVETSTHYFIIYAFYHAQDWYDGKRLADKIRKNFDEHLHDMEGALAVVTKRKKWTEERVDAFITISHFHFYCYADWMRNENEFLYPGDEWEGRIVGFGDNIDGNIWPTRDGKRNRFSLYAQSRGHGIRGDRKKWGPEHEIIMYFPSLERGEDPERKKYRTERNYKYKKVRYRLTDIHARGGLWENRNNRDVFMANAKGQDAFVDLDDNGSRIAGSANPPWGWDDIDDRHKCGELAINPALIVHDYFSGLREFSMEYVFNPYLNIG